MFNCPEWDCFPISIAYNNTTIIYGDTEVWELWNDSGFTLIEVPRRTRRILESLPASDFHFEWTDMHGIPITTPIETIQKARRLALETLANDFRDINTSPYLI